MELIRSAFLCVLVALLPQTRGELRNTDRVKQSELKFNKTMWIQQNIRRKTLLLNVNSPLVSDQTELQAVFGDMTCAFCKECMERAIKAHNSHVYMSNNRPSAQELQNDVLSNEIVYRVKRSTNKTEPDTVETSTKKAKSKKNKSQKSVTVTKYSSENDVYALKVKETQVLTDQGANKTSLSTCQVYKVKKSFPCETPEGDALLSSSRRRANKKKNKTDQSKKPTTIFTSKTNSTLSKKREVDDSQVPENVMPSSEDIY